MSRINNEFRLTGRMGSDVEVIRPDGRDPIGKVSIAVESGYRDRNSGEYVPQTTWLDLTFYNPRHTERLELHAGRGCEITVMGVIGKDVFDSKTRTNTDGSAAKDSRVTFNVSSLMLGRKPKGQDGDNHDSRSAGGQAPASGFDDMDDGDIPF